MTRATAEGVIELYSGLRTEGVRIWVDGGWGIDALLGWQIRPHKDFDAIAALEDLPVLTRFLGGRGFALKLIWEENRWAPSSELLALIGRSRPAVAAATAFVLEDGLGRELDFHIMRFDEHGRGVPAWDSALVFPPKHSPVWGLSAVGGYAACRRRCRCAPTRATRSSRATYKTCACSTTGSASTTPRGSPTCFRLRRLRATWSRTAELLRTPYRGSSENASSRRLGA